MKKIAFVVQRYGEEINGGAEFHCRQFAEKLQNKHEVTVITTCAHDYITWQNKYHPSEEIINNVQVLRFKVDQTRDIDTFNEFSSQVFQNKDNKKLAKKWMTLQGPYSTTLLNYLKQNQKQYDCIIFFTYLYATTYFGLKQVTKTKKILIPTAHDEPSIYLKIFNDVFSSPDGIIYNTEAEKTFVESQFNVANKKNIIAGIGIEEDIEGNIQEHFNQQEEIKQFKAIHNLEDYILYAGRIDESKGCLELFKYFKKFKAETKSNLKLVLIGKTELEIPANDDIIHLGFLPENEKSNAIKASTVLINPSKHESLSIILLEALFFKIPVLVNEKSQVLKDHCIKSNGGLWYANYEDFAQSLNLLLKDKPLRLTLGNNGHKYVASNYNWNSIINKISDFISTI